MIPGPLGHGPPRPRVRGPTKFVNLRLRNPENVNISSILQAVLYFAEFAMCRIAYKINEILIFSTCSISVQT